jgi:hypothetical protein
MNTEYGSGKEDHREEVHHRYEAVRGIRRRAQREDHRQAGLGDLVVR